MFRRGGKKTHILRELAQSAKVKFDNDSYLYLDILTDYIKWIGKYPVPASRKNKDEEIENIYRKFTHTIDQPPFVEKIKLGDTFIKKRSEFGGWDTYQDVWGQCIAKFNEEWEKFAP